MARPTAVAPLPKSPYITLTRVHHDGDLYTKGRLLNLTVPQAARLIEIGSVMAVRPTTTVDEADLAIDLKALGDAELREHATEIYRLDLPAESTNDAIIQAIENARAAAVVRQNA